MKFEMKSSAAAIGLIVGSVMATMAYAAGTDWEAPKDADRYTSLEKPTPASIAAGKKVYEKYCLLCHGEQGKGNGASSGSLNIKPADFTDKARMKAQSDGAIAYKIVVGRGPMPSWGPVLQEPEVWNVINYIRTFSK